MDTVMSFDILFSRQALGNGGEKHNSKFCQTNSCTKKGNKKTVITTKAPLLR